MVSTHTQKLTSFIVMDILRRRRSSARDARRPPRSGRAGFRHPACVKDGGLPGAGGRPHPLHPQPGHASNCARPSPYYYQRTYGVTVDPDQIIITSGTSPAMMLLFSALLEPGDEVIISDPHYACYPNFIKFVQGRCR